MEHGIEVLTDFDGWLWIPAADRAQADALHAATVRDNVGLACRRVARTEDGTIVTVHATE